MFSVNFVLYLMQIVIKLSLQYLLLFFIFILKLHVVLLIFLMKKYAPGMKRICKELFNHFDWGTHNTIQLYSYTVHTVMFENYKIISGQNAVFCNSQLLKRWGADDGLRISVSRLRNTWPEPHTLLPSSNPLRSWLILFRSFEKHNRTERQEMCEGKI